MKILDRKPITLAEVKSRVSDLEEKKELNDYLKEYTKLDEKKANELIEEIKSLNNLKIKDEDIIKLADLLPKDSEDVNKIFNDVSLSEEEINQIIEILNKYNGA